MIPVQRQRPLITVGIWRLSHRGWYAVCAWCGDWFPPTLFSAIMDQIYTHFAQDHEEVRPCRQKGKQ